MPQPNPSFLEEARDAAQGAWALVLGRPDAAQYFDFSARGLIGSFIALVLAIAVASFAPLLLGVDSGPASGTQAAIANVTVYAAQIGAAWLLLDRLGRLDGLVPFLVATNWVAFLGGLVLAISPLFGALGLVILFVVAIGILVVYVNIGRHVVTLSPLQIGFMLASEILASLVALVLLALLFPPAVLP